ncbi:Detected protein of unknown function [Hibiscus syriacus]|uniref:Uncharacterized protein n=1 Tax=Hibiscus syriacus TaxID=106335 RepID=A0A6A2XRG4_HIBSY|nr:uncharacterized protein LOC120163314 [Hibiscus syriacus]KAE8678172.1 Detected protein of unknown function [Hibiscus syriacus]
MACFVSLSLSVPLCSLQNPLKGRYIKESAFCRFPGLATTNKASYFLTLCSSNKSMSSANGEHYLTAMSKRFDENVSISSNASSCTRIDVIGYWVGPDIDDGWGFVEASICRPE